MWGKIRRPSSAHPLLLSSWAPKPGPRLTSVRKPSRTSRELPHAGVYVCLCVCRCLGGKYSLHLTRAPVGRTMSPLSVQAGTWEDRASNQGFWGWAISFPLSLVEGGGAPGERAGAVSSLALRVKGTAQAVWVHLELVLEPLGPSDPRAHLLLSGPVGREEPQLGSHPRQACVCAAGVCVGAGGTCQGPWFFRDLCPITCYVPGCVFAYVHAVSNGLP